MVNFIELPIAGRVSTYRIGASQSRSLRLRNADMIEFALVLERHERLDGIFDWDFGVHTCENENVDFFRAVEGFVDHLDGVTETFFAIQK